MASTEPRYVCSKCGFSRASSEVIVKHIHRSHDDEGQVLECEAAPQTRLGRVVRRLRDWF